MTFAGSREGGTQVYIFIFDVAQLTENYHSGGGLVVVAESLDAAVDLAQKDENTRLTPEEIAAVKVFKLADKKTPAQVFVFPDAGCC
jgi:hypothetical protein